MDRDANWILTNVQLHQVNVTMVTVVTRSVVIRARAMMDTLGHIVVGKLTNVKPVRVKMVQHVTTTLASMNAGAPLSMKELTAKLTSTNAQMLTFAMAVPVPTWSVGLTVTVRPRVKATYAKGT